MGAGSQCAVEFRAVYVVPGSQQHHLDRLDHGLPAHLRALRVRSGSGHLECGPYRSGRGHDDGGHRHSGPDPLHPPGAFGLPPALRVGRARHGPGNHVEGGAVGAAGNGRGLTGRHSDGELGVPGRHRGGVGAVRRPDRALQDAVRQHPAGLHAAAVAGDDLHHHRPVHAHEREGRRRRPWRSARRPVIGPAQRRGVHHPVCRRHRDPGHTLTPTLRPLIVPGRGHGRGTDSDGPGDRHHLPGHLVHHTARHAGLRGYEAAAHSRLRGRHRSRHRLPGRLPGHTGQPLDDLGGSGLHAQPGGRLGGRDPADQAAPARPRRPPRHRHLRPPGGSGHPRSACRAGRAGPAGAGRRLPDRVEADGRHADRHRGRPPHDGDLSRGRAPAACRGARCALRPTVTHRGQGRTAPAGSCRRGGPAPGTPPGTDLRRPGGHRASAVIPADIQTDAARRGRTTTGTRPTACYSGATPHVCGSGRSGSLRTGTHARYTRSTCTGTPWHGRREHHDRRNADRHRALRPGRYPARNTPTSSPACWTRYDPGSHGDDPHAHRRHPSSCRGPGIGQSCSPCRGSANPKGSRRRDASPGLRRHRARRRPPPVGSSRPGVECRAGSRHRRGGRPGAGCLLPSRPAPSQPVSGVRPTALRRHRPGHRNRRRGRDPRTGLSGRFQRGPAGGRSY